MVSYAYPYAQVIYLRYADGIEVWPDAGVVLVALSAGLSFASLRSLGRRFGVRPALRDLAIKGPYRLVRHPMYLAYIVGDIGYNLEEVNCGTLLCVFVGWASLIYRIYAEERTLAFDPRWPTYVTSTRHRLLPGIW